MSDPSCAGATPTVTPPALDRELVKGWIADLLDDGAEPATARARQLGMRRFSVWLEEEGEIDTDPLLDSKVVASLTDDELRRLIKACGGKGSATAATTRWCG